MRIWTNLGLMVLVACEGGGGDVCPDEPAESLTHPFAYEWTWSHERQDAGVRSAPVWGQLTDDNGDGRIDDADILDVVFTSVHTNAVVALHGDGSGPIFELKNERMYWGASIGDVDGDGKPDVVAWDTTMEISVLDGTGRLKGTYWPDLNSRSPLHLADVNGDNVVDIMVNGVAYDAKNDAELFSLPLDIAVESSIVRDIDQDGTPEVIMGLSVYSHDGQLEWTAGSGASLEAYRAFAVVPEQVGGELYFFIERGGASEVYVYSGDGTLRRQFTVPLHPTTQPMLGTFTGDDALELAIVGGGQVGVYTVYGEEQWRHTQEEIYAIQGLAVGDISGDGQIELLHTVGDTLSILDGATGDTVFEDAEQSDIGALWIYPQLVDVVGDGSTELVVSHQRAGGEGGPSLSLYSRQTNGWVHNEECPD